MSKKSTLKPIAAALGATFVVSLAVSPVANAAENPFSLTAFDSGYEIAGDHEKEGKCGEGKCGDKNKEEGKCGEGKCGDKEGDKMKAEEGKCGEGKCGDKKKEEGKCGEGKCGDKK